MRIKLPSVAQRNTVGSDFWGAILCDKHSSPDRLEVISNDLRNPYREGKQVAVAVMTQVAGPSLP